MKRKYPPACRAALAVVAVLLASFLLATPVPGGPNLPVDQATAARQHVLATPFLGAVHPATFAAFQLLASVTALVAFPSKS